MLNPIFFRAVVYSAPLTLPVAVVAISRFVIWLCGIAWEGDIAGGVAFSALFFAMPGGVVLIAAAHDLGWFRRYDERFYG